MRPFIVSYTPLAAATTYFATGLTGATGVIATPAVSDGLAHFVTLASAANLSGITMTLTGLDADGQAQTEAIVGPNITTVTGVKYFSRVNTITFGATLGANTMDVGISAVAISQTLPINYLQSSFSSTQMVAITGTINYTVQYTEAAIYDAAPSTLTWFSHATLASKTASADGSITSPFRALRLLINSVTASATISLTSIQTRG